MDDFQRQKEMTAHALRKQAVILYTTDSPDEELTIAVSTFSIRSIVYFTGFVKRRARCRNRRFFRDETYRLHQLG